VIKGDWQTIQRKVGVGKAHEISEGDTNYLGACTKGATGKDRRPQPRSRIPAKPRAFAIKQTYVTTTILQDFVRRALFEKRGRKGKFFAHSIIGKEFVLSKATFEAYIQEKFRIYFGKSIEELHEKFDVKCDRKAKSYYSIVTKEIIKKILGVEDLKVLEFEKANISIKTIRLDLKGRPKEAMSFPAINYKKLLEEDWESSEFYELLQRRYFFVVFQYDATDRLYLKNAFFWCVPVSDQDTIKKVWERTKQKVSIGDYDNFPKASDGKIAHVRPHALNSRDYADTPGGEKTVKKSFWLNQDYLQEEIGKYIV